MIMGTQQSCGIFYSAKRILLVSAFSSQTLSFEGDLHIHSELGNSLI